MDGALAENSEDLALKDTDFKWRLGILLILFHRPTSRWHEHGRSATQRRSGCWAGSIPFCIGGDCGAEENGAFSSELEGSYMWRKSSQYFMWRPCAEPSRLWTCTRSRISAATFRERKNDIRRSFCFVFGLIKPLEVCHFGSGQFRNGRRCSFC